MVSIIYGGIAVKHHAHIGNKIAKRHHVFGKGTYISSVVTVIVVEARLVLYFDILAFIKKSTEVCG